MQLYLIGNLSNSSGQKSAKNSGEENPGITYTLAERRPRVRPSITRLFYLVSVLINYNFNLSVFRFPKSWVKIDLYWEPRPVIDCPLIIKKTHLKETLLLFARSLPVRVQRLPEKCFVKISVLFGWGRQYRHCSRKRYAVSFVCCINS